MQDKTGRDRWHRLWSIFHRVQEAEPFERQRLLADLCGGDEDLRAEVEELLAAGDESGEFLSSAGVVSDILGGPEHSLEAARTGDQIGRYTIVRKIGEGGAGSVYLAHRHDGELEQVVALKLLRPTAGDPRLLERFGLEREILARLRHPGIGRVLDAGTTDDGAPYLALEYIEGGEPVDGYCRDRGLSLQERLELFAEICDAVAYAHRNLVVHRDLKPANILVRADGRPKLLDFGIAKLIEVDPDRTETVVQPMTPRYASPEQVRGEPVSTATDVYALGVLLYELLTGRSPYRGNSESGLEWMRAIVEETPSRPSTTAPGSTAGEQVRSIGPAVIDPRRLRGDLDAIVLRALAKEPERRYASAAQLADDVRRFLRDEPVSARPDSWRYRTRKFVERHRWGVAVAAAILLMVVVAAVATTVLSVRLAHALQQQTEQRQLAEQTAAFLNDLFEAADPRRGSGEELGARDVLVQGARRITRDPELVGPIRARLGGTVVQALIGIEALDEAEALLRELKALDEVAADALASVRLQAFEAEVAYERSEYEASGELATGALATLGERSGVEAETLRAALELRLALVYSMDGSMQQATATLAKAMSSAASSSDDPLLANALLVAGRVRMFHGDWQGAEDALRRARALAEEAPGGLGFRHANALRELGLLLLETNRLDEATEVLQESVARLEQIVGEDSPRLPLTYLGNALHGRGDLAAAERVLQRSLEISRRAFGEDSPKVAADHTNVGWLLHNRGAFEQARGHYLQSVELHEKGSGPDTTQLVPPLNNLGLVHLDLGDLSAAPAYFERARELIETKLGREHPALGFVLTNLGRLEAERGNRDEAERLYRQALELRRRALPADHIELGLTLTGLGDLLCQDGRHEEGERLLREALAIRSKKTAPTDWRIALTENDLGACLVAQGRVAEGRSLIENSVDRIVAQRGEHDPRAKRALERLRRDASGR